MPELRRDPLLDRWVIIATERGNRPTAFDLGSGTAIQVEAANDPFAEGNERYTTPEVYAVRSAGSSPNGPGWRVRVIPNKYPALRIEGGLEPHGEGVYDRLNGIGAHEVVIECPWADKQLMDLPVPHIAEVLGAYRQRVEDLSRDKRFAHVLVFKNHGQSAGATQPHSHSQIIATPIVPKRVLEQIVQLNHHWKEKRRSLFQDMLDQEVRQRERLVYENDLMLAFCPFASSFAFEVNIFPKILQPDFRRAGIEDLRALAQALKAVLLKWRQVLGNVDYNFLIHTVPNDTVSSGVRDDYPMLDTYYHWHLEMFPRTSKPAGFEWGTGYYINPVAPEEAARYLAAVEVELE